MSWGGQSSVMRSGLPGPKNPKSSAMKTTTWRCSIIQRAQRSKKFKISIEIENFDLENEIFERATHRGPIFCGEIETSRLKFSSAARSKISIETENFDRDQIFLIVGRCSVIQREIPRSQSVLGRNVCEGTLWKLNRGADPLDEESWCMRDLCLTATGQLMYHSMKESMPAAAVAAATAPLGPLSCQMMEVFVFFFLCRPPLCGGPPRYYFR